MSHHLRLTRWWSAATASVVVAFIARGALPVDFLAFLGGGTLGAIAGRLSLVQAVRIQSGSLLAAAALHMWGAPGAAQAAVAALTAGCGVALGTAFRPGSRAALLRVRRNGPRQLRTSSVFYVAANGVALGALMLIALGVPLPNWLGPCAVVVAALGVLWSGLQSMRHSRAALRSWVRDNRLGRISKAAFAAGGAFAIAGVAFPLSGRAVPAWFLGVLLGVFAVAAAMGVAAKSRT